jgi:protein TonB
MMYALYRLRNLLGWIPALLAVALVVFSLQRTPLKIEPTYDESAVEVALFEPEPEPETPAPEPVVEAPEPPPAPEPIPEPEPVPVVEAQEPVVEAPPPPPKPRPEPKPEPKPKPVVQPKPKPAPVVAKPTPPRPVEPVKPEVAAAKPAPTKPAAPKVDHQAAEGGYLKGIRSDLDRYKQYPTGRQASLERPSGDVVIWLLVDRAGKVLDSGIQDKASSMLLNRAATNSLRRIQQVKPFPAEAFAGQSQLRITATFNYSTP